MNIFSDLFITLYYISNKIYSKKTISKPNRTFSESKSESPNIKQNRNPKTKIHFVATFTFRRIYVWISDRFGARSLVRVIIITMHFHEMHSRSPIYVPYILYIIFLHTYSHYRGRFVPNVRNGEITTVSRNAFETCPNAKIGFILSVFFILTCLCIGKTYFFDTCSF